MQYWHVVAQRMFVKVFKFQDGPDLGQETLIACMAGQAILPPPGSLSMNALPRPCIWGSQVEGRVRGHGPNVSKTPGTFKK